MVMRFLSPVVDLSMHYKRVNEYTLILRNQISHLLLLDCIFLQACSLRLVIEDNE